jgi:Tol biopolymer transport system component
MRRALIAAGLVLAMSAFGIGVYQAAAYLKAGPAHVQRPNQTTAPSLPGTIYVVQAGAIYRLQNGKFGQITSEAGWMQPAADMNGSRLVAARRQSNVSDLYLLDRNGRITGQLTHNSSSTVEFNHWAFYPRFSPDGSQIFYDYDPKDSYNSYRADLAIFASPADTGAKSSIQWSYPNQYTGGDVNPVPLHDGGLIYTRFSIDGQSKVHSQIWLQSRPGSPGVALTDPEADCLQPALSPDEHLLAMVCAKAQPMSVDLVLAGFNPTTRSLGTSSVLTRGQLAASPSFSPDGKTVAYLAPATSGGGFQLWTIAGTQSAAPTPRQITSELDLAGTSAPVWIQQ